MTNPNSPIIDFYPNDFQLDMNGKKQEWEAIVKIPFIDQKRLVAALKGELLNVEYFMFKILIYVPHLFIRQERSIN